MKNVTLQSPDPKSPERRCRPCVNLHLMIWPHMLQFDFPKIHRDPPQVDFESSRSPVKSENWKNSYLQFSALFPTCHYCSNSLVRWTQEIKRTKRSSQALVHIVAARASLFADHKISGLPVRAKCRHLRTIWEQTFDNSRTDHHSSSLNWRSSRHGVETLYGCWVVSFANSQYLSTYFFAWPPMS